MVAVTVFDGDGGRLDEYLVSSGFAESHGTVSSTGSTS